VPPAGVVEAFDVPEDPDARLLAGREALAPQQFLLEAGEEGLGERVGERRLLRSIPSLSSDLSG
jgi:hypothetical protein